MDRIYLTIGAEPEFEAHPLGYAESAIRIDKERGQVFYRRNFDGELVFINSDFDAILAHELSENRCEPITIRIERNGDAYWTGLIRLSNGSFDLDRCTFIVTPIPSDAYEPFITNGDAAINVTELEPKVTVTHPLLKKVYDRGVDWMQMIRAVVNNIDGGITVNSDFFEEAENYVTLQDNRHNHLVIFQKSDVKRPQASEPARVGDMSFNSLMEILRSLFNVYWDIVDGEMIMEHLSYFEDATDVTDLRGVKGEAGLARYRYDAAQLPRSEGVTLEGASSDFIGRPITYDVNCAEGEAEEIKLPICNQIRAIENQNIDTPDQGWAILACDSDGVEREILTGVASDGAQVNGYMSMYILMEYYWRHGRVLPVGIMNGRSFEFLSSRRVRLQELNISECLGIEPYNAFETRLTDIIGQQARLSNARVKVDGSFNIQLAYESEAKENLGITKLANVFYSELIDISGGSRAQLGSDADGGVLDIDFAYLIQASATGGETDSGIKAITKIHYTVDDGVTWTTVDEVEATVPFGGGSDFDSSSGIFSINGISDITQVRIEATYDLTQTAILDLDGYVSAEISNATWTEGDATVVKPNIFIASNNNDVIV